MPELSKTTIDENGSVKEAVKMSAQVAMSENNQALNLKVMIHTDPQQVLELQLPLNGLILLLQSHGYRIEEVK